MKSSVHRVPDYLAPIAGARAWKLAPNLLAKMHGILWSMAMLKCWPNGKEMVAECDAGHPAPAKGCSCGVHAWKSVEKLLDSAYVPRDHETIAGVVAGAGRFFRGHAGYWVAERAVVLAFFDDGYPSPTREVMPGSGIYLPTKEDAARVYDVPIMKYSEFNDFCNEYGLVRF